MGRSPRLAVAAIVALFSLVVYFRSATVNPVTGKKQHVGAITPQQEIALGLQAAPDMARQYGGESDDPRVRQLVDDVGQRVLSRSDAGKTPYRYQFHALADPNTINAFALPGGQVFVTEGLLKRLRTRGQLAGVLGHEIGHVVARHGAQHLAKQQLTQGLTGAAVLATYDPDNPDSMRTAQAAALVGRLVTMKFGRDDESESDALGVRFMRQAGFDPKAMIGVMEVLKTASGGRTPEFFSTHPNPDNRIARIKQAIQALPPGVPADLEP